MLKINPGSNGKKRGFDFYLFLAVFILSAATLSSNLVEKSLAVSDYSELQARARTDAPVTVNAAAVKDGTVGPDIKERSTLYQDEGNKRKTSMDFSSLKDENPDIIGWIWLPGSKIDYPVVQADNNDYYINHMYNRKQNGSGAIFADYRNASDFSDRNTVIYGHHMKNGTMFYDLEKYKKQSFFDENPTMMLYTPMGDYLVELLCGVIENGDEQFVEFVFFSEEEFMEYVEKFRARSTFVSDVKIEPGDKLVSLCTCSYEHKNGRYMVMGKLVPVIEEKVE